MSGDGDAAAENYHAWDIAYSETWGPPYDATSKLWDMTHGLASWCSQQDAAICNACELRAALRTGNRGGWRIMKSMA